MGSSVLCRRSAPLWRQTGQVSANWWHNLKEMICLGALGSSLLDDCVQFWGAYVDDLKAGRGASSRLPAMWVSLAGKGRDR